MEYINSADTIIFEPKFNEVLNGYDEILLGIKKIVFSNYALKEELFEYYSMAWDEFRITYNYHYFISSQFNRSVDNLPQNITHIIFGDQFNQCVDNLPSYLTHLTFGCKFSQPVDNLPIHLTHLTFAYNFNYPLNSLPNSIKELTLSSNFSHSLDNLPQGIQIIKFYQYGKYNFDLNCLPNSIQEIQLPNYNKSIEKIPTQLKKIICEEKYPFVDYFKNLGIEVSTYF